MNHSLPTVGATEPPADPARLFIALWPPAELAAELRARYDSARGNVPARPEAAERLHLTLHFLGNVPRRRLPALQAVLCVPFSPFELVLRACERWPRGLVVAETDRVPAALVALHAALAQALEAAGLQPDNRPWRAHVTLARRHVGAWPAALQESPPLRWPVQDFVLAESVPGPRSHYRVLQTCRSVPDRPQTAPAAP